LWLLKCRADATLDEILYEVSVQMALLEEARRRRDRVLTIAEEHDAARDGADFASGSVAHGTANRSLEDADCGVKVNRRFEASRFRPRRSPGPRTRHLTFGRRIRISSPKPTQNFRYLRV
jgi:hypothetical protein